MAPGKVPMSTIPPAAVHRKARLPELPTITDPSALAATALEEVVPGRTPRDWSPCAGVHRMARPEGPVPTTTVPSPLMPLALAPVRE
jgi:hypothetical protein